MAGGGGGGGGGGRSSSTCAVAGRLAVDLSLSVFHDFGLLRLDRPYMGEILPIRRKTLYNHSIEQPTFRLRGELSDRLRHHGALKPFTPWPVAQNP